MTTPLFICGAGCGIADIGTASAGTEHWSAAGSAITSATGSPISGTRSFLALSFGATTADFLEHTFASAIASGGTMVARFHLKMNAAVAGGRTIFSTPDGLAGLKMESAFGNVLLTAWAGNASPNEQSTGVLTLGQVYLLDVKITRGTTISVDWQVDEVAQTQATKSSQTATTIPGFRIGSNPNGTGGNGNIATNWQIDDICVSGTSGDYPIGEGVVLALYPNGDKTNSAATPTDGNGGHLYSSTTDFGKGSGGSTAVGAQNSESTSWQSLANPLSVSVGTNFIADLLGSSTEHMVWTMEDMPTPVAVHGVMLVATTHSATASANTQTMVITDSAGANALTAWNLLDMSESAITVPVATFATKPGGGAWDKTAVDACLVRWGDSTDVTPDVYLDGVCLEVSYDTGGLARTMAAPVDTATSAKAALTTSIAKTVDPFTRADSSTSLGTAPTGQTWVARVGTWGISTNRAYVATDGGLNIATVRGYANGSVKATATVVPGIGDTVGVVFRYQDTSNYWYAETIPAFSTWNLYKVVAGVTTQLGNTGLTNTADGAVVEIDFVGSTIRIYIDGTGTTYTDSALSTQTGEGLYATSVNGKLDDFQASPYKEFAGKAAISISAKATRLNRTRALAAKVGTADAAKATKLTSSKLLLAKLATASSAKASLKSTRPITAKSATSDGAKATKLNQTKRFLAKAATSDGAKATMLARLRPVVAKLATASSAKASARTTRSILAKAATAASAKALRIARARPIAAKAPAADGAKAVRIALNHGIIAKAGTASSAKTRLDTRRAELAVHVSTAVSAKATKLIQSKRFLAKGATASSAKASLRTARLIAAKASSASSAKGALRVTRVLHAKAATADGARVTKLNQTKRLLAKLATASSAKASLAEVKLFLAKVATASSLKLSPVPLTMPPVVLGTTFEHGSWVRFPLKVKSGAVVTITVDRTAGVNAVMSGVFLGSMVSTPHYGVQGTDGASPQGAWVGTYGAEGYALARSFNDGGDYVNMPLCTFATGGLGFLWEEAPVAPEARCLTDHNGTANWIPNNGGTQYQGVWYAPSGSFDTTLTFTSDYTGDLALYVIDFDAASRQETITVTAPVDGLRVARSVVAKAPDASSAKASIAVHRDVPITAAIASFSARVFTPSVGGVTKTLTASQASFSAQVVTPVRGAVTAPLVASVASFSARPMTPTLGGVTRTLTAAAATFSARTLSLTVGPVTRPLTAATASFSARALTPSRGGVTRSIFSATGSFLASPMVVTITFDPNNLQLNLVLDTAHLTWDASTSIGIIDYSVFRRSPATGIAFNPAVDTPVADGIVGTSYDDTGLTDTLEYEWQVFGRVP